MTTPLEKALSLAALHSAPEILRVVNVWDVVSASAVAALPALAALRDATGESTQLYVREHQQRICVAALESPHGLRTIVPLGAALPLDRGSAGKVLLEADGVAERGWAESVGEREPGVASVSAPVATGLTVPRIT